jgi:hypothetical protein
MSEPVVYVSTFRIREGKLPEYRRLLEKLVRTVDANEPHVPAFLTFANDDQTEITNVHVFPDAMTLDRHMAVLAEQMGLLPTDLAQVMQYLEPVGIQVYGAPGGQAAAMDDSLRNSGVPFSGASGFLGGFTRGGTEAG